MKSDMPAESQPCRRSRVPEALSGPQETGRIALPTGLPRDHASKVPAGRRWTGRGVPPPIRTGPCGYDSWLRGRRRSPQLFPVGGRRALHCEWEGTGTRA